MTSRRVGGGRRVDVRIQAGTGARGAWGLCGAGEHGAGAGSGSAGAGLASKAVETSVICLAAAEH